ncbi:MAG: GGDEF domain-containing protein [Desulfarculales bacterium]|jgi:diguanylate cyclase (GGDEF)-like protein|nr:GGDEF domain-containing protein [Desulfarculales bacterium]
MNELALRLLRHMEIVVFERKGPLQYQREGMVPDFYRQVFPDDANGDPCSEPWRHSPMLEFFLPLAENFFGEGGSGEINSGVWLEAPLTGAEEGKMPEDLPLTASALVLGDAQVFVLQCARDEYAERARILRQARNELLERRKVYSDLALFRKKSLYDAMTDLYNHAAFMDILNERMTNHKSYHAGLALLFMDIDNFKQINDAHGHLAGDSVLIQLGDILRRSLRKNDVPARYGGEEFAVLASRTTLQQGRIIGEKLRQTVEKHDFGIGQAVTISIGVSIYKSGEDAAKFINRADQALYDAKHGGRNRVEVRMPWLDE